MLATALAGAAADVPVPDHTVLTAVDRIFDEWERAIFSPWQSKGPSRKRAHDKEDWLDLNLDDALLDELAAARLQRGTADRSAGPIDRLFLATRAD